MGWHCGFDRDKAPSHTGTAPAQSRASRVTASPNNDDGFSMMMEPS